MTATPRALCLLAALLALASGCAHGPASEARPQEVLQTSLEDLRDGVLGRAWRSEPGSGIEYMEVIRGGRLEYRPLQDVTVLGFEAHEARFRFNSCKELVAFDASVDALPHMEIVRRLTARYGPGEKPTCSHQGSCFLRLGHWVWRFGMRGAEGDHGRLSVAKGISNAGYYTLLEIQVDVPAKACMIRLQDTG